MNPAPAPEGILDPKQPYWPADRVSERTWVTFRAKLTGKSYPELQGATYTTFVSVTDSDVDKIIANIKKYGQYPTVNQNDKYGGALNLEAYQKWLVEEFLEKPFREQTDKKIEEAAIQSRLKEIQETRDEVKKVETKEEVVVVIEDKVEVLESILQDISPSRSEYQVEDPWEGSYETPKAKPQATVKKTTKKKGRPKGSKNKTSKKKKPAPAAGPTPPDGGDPPPKKSFASKMGGGLKKVGRSLGKTLIDKLEGAAPIGENMGPSVLSAGIWVGKKITTAFKDAKTEQERAAEAEANGAELPPETKEKGYYLKKALGYQFGGRVLDQTVGAFFENIPSKQSSKKAGFGDTFDYGDKDPKKKKQQAQQQSEIKDLASGFRNVTKSLGGINQAINQLSQTMAQLVGQTTRVADILEGIQISIGQSIDVEIDSGSDAAGDSGAGGGDSGGGINIGDINLGGDGEGGLDILDILGGVDNILDIARLRKGKKGLARQNPSYKKARKAGMPKAPKMRAPGGLGRFGMIKNVMNMGRTALSEGTGPVKGQVNAMVGEAGPEIVTGSPQKLASGGLMPGGTGSSILATGLGAGVGDLMKRVQPFANLMAAPFQVIGAHISGALSNLVAAAGPFSGAIAKMFSPLLGGLATIFGLNQGAFAAEINSAAMTEEQGAKQLSKFFANFFKLFGINIGGGGDEDNDDDDDDESVAKGQWGPMLDLIASGEGGYDSVNPSLVRPEIKDMNLSQLLSFKVQSKSEKGGSAALGRYQFINPTLAYQYAGLDPSEKFTPANQDKMGVAYLEKKRPGKEWLAGEMSTRDYIEELSNEWGAFRSYSGNVLPGNSGKIPPEKIEEALNKVKGKPATQAARGVAKSTKVLNNVDGIFEMTGPFSGYKVPEDLTGGQKVVGHGLEWLIKMPNKFVILPGVNKEYNVYKDPEETFIRYEKIASQGGIDRDRLTNTMNKVIFGESAPEGETPEKEVERLKAAAPQTGKPLTREQQEIDQERQNKLAAAVSRLGQPKLPTGNITPVAIPKDTVTGTTTNTSSVVAVVQPVIQYVPVAVPGPTRIIEVPANQFATARLAMEMNYLQSLS